MSMAEATRSPALVALQEGESLDQLAFHERYSAESPRVRAELIGGRVFRPPMVGSEHGDHHVPIVGLFFLYQRATPGVRANIESSTVLNPRNEVQPDGSLRILEEYGGQSRTFPQWIEGAPELVVEIARSGRAIDLGPKLVEYQEAGVKEYVVLALDPDQVYWHVREGRQLVEIAPAPDGIYRSRVFPGLWLDPSAYFRLDLDGLVATLEQGLGSPEHAEFVQLLGRNRLEVTARD